MPLFIAPHGAKIGRERPIGKTSGIGGISGRGSTRLVYPCDFSKFGPIPCRLVYPSAYANLQCGLLRSSKTLALSIMFGLSTMTENYRPRVRYVIGPDGSPLTGADLPPRDTKRWVIRRKAEVVAAVRGGLISLEEACERYTLTVDEFLSWQRSIDKHGLPGLRATRIQEYRGS